MLKEIAEQEKKTIVLSTHNPNHALFLESDVVLLHDGRIIGHGKAVNEINKQNLEPIYGNKLCLSKELPYKEISFK